MRASSALASKERLTTAASPERTAARTASSNWKKPRRSGKSLLIDLTREDQKIKTRENIHGEQP
jgi:hypothetical protein